jgi:hypothetical protein
MIKKIRLLLEYNTYCVWLYNEKDEIIDNDNPPEWNDNQNLTDAFMNVSNIYDTFFIDNEKEFSYIGCPSEEKLQELMLLKCSKSKLVYQELKLFVLCYSS